MQHQVEIEKIQLERLILEKEDRDRKRKFILDKLK